MQTLHAFLVSLALTSTALAAVDEPCFGSGGRSGVCLKTSDCSAKGGVSITGACPSDPENVRCCTKASCSNGSGGNCRWTSDCAGSTASNQCPGPSQFKCCSSTASGFGGYDAPKLPAVGACKSVAVSGARKVVAAWPGRIRAVVCARDCACRSGFEHCCGTATDFECSDSAGSATASGRAIAEWVMNHGSELNLKSVIFGQRIWSSNVDGIKPWSSWRDMEDHGSITANHWDHVHVSYD